MRLAVRRREYRILLCNTEVNVNAESDPSESTLMPVAKRHPPLILPVDGKIDGLRLTTLNRNDVSTVEYRHLHLESMKNLD